jgi:hypothetical protein
LLYWIKERGLVHRFAAAGNSMVNKHSSKSTNSTNSASKPLGAKETYNSNAGSMKTASWPATLNIEQRSMSYTMASLHMTKSLPLR